MKAEINLNAKMSSRIALRDVMIYTLTNPENGEIFYVGRTSTPLKHRLYQHLGPQSVNGEMENYLSQIVSRGIKPVIEELDSVGHNEKHIAEVYWIHQLKAWGFNLLNKSTMRSVQPKFKRVGPDYNGYSTADLREWMIQYFKK
jgi:hypothetical protein